jgi:uncharacterized protein YbaP (TraB family)
MTIIKTTIYFPLLLLFNSTIFCQNAGGLFWSVVKPGSKDTSYLLGTMHKYPRNVVELPGVVEQKMGKCQHLYIEIRADKKLKFKRLFSGSIKNAKAIRKSKNWTDEDWDKIKEWFVETHNMDEATFNKLKPQISHSTFTELFLSLYGYGKGAMENDLENLALQRNLSIKGLDRSWNQIQSWYAYYAKKQSIPWQEGTIDSSLNNSFYRFADLIIAYAIQDTSTINAYRTKEVWENGLTLVEWRNHNWIPQLKKLMKEKTMVAIGAAHLFGTHGVINLLRNEGFNVQPVGGHFGGEKLERFIRMNSRQYEMSNENLN